MFKLLLWTWTNDAGASPPPTVTTDDRRRRYIGGVRRYAILFVSLLPLLR